MIDSELNSAATYIVLSGIIPAVGFFLVYGIGSPWYKSALGVVMFLLGFSISATFLQVVTRRIAGDYPGYGLVTIIVYSLVTIALWGLFIIVLTERRHPATSPLFIDRKAVIMISKNPVTPTVSVPEIWYKGQRVIRSVLVTLPVLLVVANASLPLLADAFGKTEGVPVSVVIVVNAVVGGATVVVGVLTRIIAIPAVNAWLTKLGAGSVPRKALR